MIQIIFVYSFLTCFFFVYVQEVEKNEFVSQMNLIVDDVIKEVENDIPNIINKSNLDNIENLTIIINGLTDLLEEKITVDAKSSVKNVYEQNKDVKLKAFKSLMFFITIVVVISIVLLLLGFCLNILYQIKEAMLVVIFVGLTELIFLEVIAKRFISADPNKVQREMGIAVHNWIKKNK